ncbi:MAG: hypothetical protein ACHQM4_07745 [Thermoanaerobaculia bacterium]
MKRAAFLVLAVLIAASTAGFGSSGIVYVPSAPPAQTTRAVVLKVVDNRPPREGGREPRVVGLRRSMVGIKANINESGPDVVPNLVRAATEDALGRAGIRASDSAKVTLTAQILCFWMDWSGFAFAGAFSHLKYQGAIAVEYTLQDASGRVLWKGLAVTEQHHSSDSKERIFNPALRRLAGRAANRFQATEFANAVPET